jgi:hypothetical protein
VLLSSEVRLLLSAEAQEVARDKGDADAEVEAMAFSRL